MPGKQKQLTVLYQPPALEGLRGKTNVSQRPCMQVVFAENAKLSIPGKHMLHSP